MASLRILSPMTCLKSSRRAASVLLVLIAALALAALLVLAEVDAAVSWPGCWGGTGRTARASRRAPHLFFIFGDAPGARSRGGVLIVFHITGGVGQLSLPGGGRL